MTKHSTLTDPNDLHYAKLRSFTGDISLVAPDFIDQILSATDTNKIYRASGTGLGDLIEFQSTPLPPVSIANEWIPLSPDDSLQVGKSYIKKTNNAFFCTLPLDAISGQSINLFNLESQLLLNSQGLPIVRSSLTSSSPYSSSGQIVACGIAPRIMSQLTFDGDANRWILVQGEINTQFYSRGGCTDSSADNYDPLATVDDGSCTYPVLGCTDSSADNYDPLATVDDGSCTYS